MQPTFSKISIHGGVGIEETADVTPDRAIQALKFAADCEGGGVSVDLFGHGCEVDHNGGLSFWWQQDGSLALDFYINGFGSAIVTFDEASEIIKRMVHGCGHMHGREALKDMVSKWVV